VHNITDFSLHIRANKFNPPRLGTQKILVRSPLIRKYFTDQSWQFTIIEAQPGQGKTTTAIQYLSQADSQYLWYQVGPEDRDPLYFISALFEGLLRTFPEFSSPRAAALLQRAELSPADGVSFVNLILADLQRVLAGECTFVFDDLHLMAESGPSLAIVDYILETAPDNFSFVILSRKPLNFSSKRLRYGSSTLFLGNDDLAFSLAETGELLEIIRQRPTDPRVAARLAHQSGGWVMGLVLAAGSRTGCDLVLVPGRAETDDLLMTYFEEEFFAQLNPDQQQLLLRLSLLDDIVVELGREITGEPETGAMLLQLMDENCFIRSQDDNATLFSIHHLFLELLRSKAEQLLDKELQQTILAQAASYCLQRDLLGPGLHYLLRAEAFADLEEQLSSRGMEMVFMNRLPTLASILENIPDERIAASPWFSLFCGFVVQKSDPGRSQAMFAQARSLFQGTGHSMGELVTLGELIFFHVLLQPDSSRCLEYLHDADILFARCGAELPSFCRANTAKNIGIGFFYFLNDFERALDYTRIAETEAVTTGSPSQLLEILVSRGIIHLYRGEFKVASAVAERIYSIMSNSSCGMRGRMAGMYFLFQMLHLQGDHRGYHRYKQVLEQTIDPQQFSVTLLHAYITLYDIYIAVAEGHQDQALALIAAHADKGFFQMVCHLKQEMLAARTLILAQDGRFDAEGRRFIDTILPFAGKDTAPLNRLKLLLPLAMASAAGGEPAVARTLADRTIALARKSGIVLFECYGCLLRAYLATLDDAVESARDDLHAALHYMQVNGVSHIRCFTPVELSAVLQLAVTLDVHTDFIRQLAGDSLGLAIRDDGEVVPLLFITTLGDFELSIQGYPVARGTDLTTIQRQLLGLLISRPRLEISEQQAQLILWPNVPAVKGRNRFDALLFRLRKALAVLLGKYPVKNYLVFEKGILSLRNCRIDAREFSRCVQQGLVHGLKDQWWQAGNRLDSALELWAGPFSEDLLPGDESVDYGRELLQQLTTLGLSWCPALEENGRPDKAIAIAEKIVKETSHDEQMVHLLYELYLRNNEPVQAKKLYARYEEVLQSNDYPDAEIQHLLKQISIAAEPKCRHG
jgi:ATP/maltotriose-dependent transcriptional regulator MalT/DNA-binding SARP family transcriptional activator